MPEVNYRNKEQDRRLNNIDKHLAKINEEMGAIQINIAKIKGRLSWYNWLLPVLTAALGFLINQLL